MIWYNQNSLRSKPHTFVIISDDDEELSCCFRNVPALSAALVFFVITTVVLAAVIMLIAVRGIVIGAADAVSTFKQNSRMTQVSNVCICLEMHKLHTMVAEEDHPQKKNRMKQPMATVAILTGM